MASERSLEAPDSPVQDRSRTGPRLAVARHWWPRNYLTILSQICQTTNLFTGPCRLSWHQCASRRLQGPRRPQRASREFHTPQRALRKVFRQYKRGLKQVRGRLAVAPDSSERGLHRLSFAPDRSRRAPRRPRNCLRVSQADLAWYPSGSR